MKINKLKGTSLLFIALLLAIFAEAQINKVTDLRSSYPNSTSVNLLWTVPANATSYTICYGQNAQKVSDWDVSCFKQSGNIPAGTSTAQVVIDTLKTNKRYYFAVQMYNGIDSSQISNIARGKPFPDPFIENFSSLNCNTDPNVITGAGSCSNNCEGGYWNLNVSDNSNFDFVSYIKRDTSSSGKALQIVVDSNDSVCMGNAVNLTRTRAEIMIDPEHGHGNTYYYAWSFYLPLGSDEVTVVDGKKSYYTIAQWLFDNAADGTCKVDHGIPVNFSYEPKTSATDSTRKLMVSYGVRRKESCADTIRYQDDIEIGTFKKGTWVDMITKIHWSPTDAGYIKIWFNNDSCAKKISGPNMYYLDNDPLSIPLPNRFKMGIYRGHKLAQTDTIFIDEVSFSRNLNNLALPPNGITPVKGECVLSDLTLKVNNYASQYDMEIESVHLTPNPANSSVVVKTKDVPASMSITDLHGNLIKEIKVTGIETSVNVENLPEGIYVIVVVTKNQVIRSKLKVE